ncbi:MAG: hypothetical protein ACW9W3_01810 [Candidatus Nitrosopumilus sp. bin_68KS]
MGKKVQIDAITKNQMKQALISFTIEQSLIDGGGKEIFDKTIDDLRHKFDCDTSECYNHPEYFIQILNEMPKRIQEKIIKTIIERLKEFEYQEEIKEFIRVLSKNKKS